MYILEELVHPLSLSDFKDNYFGKEPFATPQKAVTFKNLINWLFLQDIFESGHKDCWLPHHGSLPKQPELSSGTLTIDQALEGYAQGRTVLVRHAEKAHPVYAALARNFHECFVKPVDVQLYCTPKQQEGFNWHYDVEDVFIIQTSGEKEFRLRKNTMVSLPLDARTSQAEIFKQEKSRSEICCWLKAGDWLYIPAGYWHKAKALSDSCHLSIGVMYSA